MQPPDTHHLSAAEGWLGLGNPREAALELDLISGAAQSHVDVLEARWQVCAREKNWRGCADVGFSLVRLKPNEVSGWIHRSYGLHEMKQTREAFELLLPAAKLFPREMTVPYNLACYCCQLGDLEGAMRWLEQARALDKAKTVKQSALADADLAPLRDKIAKL